MRIYDVHIHAEGNRSPQPSKLIENLEKAGVYGGNVISVRPEESYGRIKMCYEDRMKNVIAWTKGYEDRLFPVLWMHPREKDIIDKIKDASERGIRAFKMICDNYYVHDEMSMKVIEAVAQTKKPLMFHSGILWIGNAVAGEYNKPMHWEHLLNMAGLRFSMAHCSWPWYDECIALYGRMMAAYRNSPNGASEMYFDLTPGTPEIYREDLFSKLFRIGYDVPHNTMFGADMSAEDYDSEYTKGWLALDNSLYDKLGIAEETRELIYEKNFLEFMGVAEKTHKPRPRWKISDKV